ncbi:hypothetical protein [Streptomyces corynorhini]|uniref:Uncharacterized protein n=1 Tax=Streptomyces corynorhini TaxID=2282652 RepID=A0A370B279_9ACTN|nr:hypothetical protein [Streptomyces corynorhini]RDG34772.1 hypothetical protein DVH02_28785 [Streptomyces corynorhini]
MRRPRLFGVIGTPYVRGPAGLTALATPDVPVPYTDRATTRWFLASQLISRLCDVTPVSLGDELATA